MSGIIALCALVAVAAVVLPLFGPRVAAFSAVVVVAGIVFACFLICVPSASTRSTRHGLRGGPERDI
ncbi:MAG TPA: hypothetical protein VI007_11990 [bacterium]